MWGEESISPVSSLLLDRNNVVVRAIADAAEPTEGGRADVGGSAEGEEGAAAGGSAEGGEGAAAGGERPRERANPSGIARQLGERGGDKSYSKKTPKQRRKDIQVSY